MKNKAWVQYTKTGQIVPGSLLVSPRRPVNGVWYEVVENICCDENPPYGVIQSKKKAFVKYSSSGHIVPGSLTLTTNLPKPGIWKEVYINGCCITSNLGSYCYVVTALTGECGVKWIDSTGAQQTGIISVFDPEFADLKLCAQKDSVVVKPQGKGTYSLIGGTSVCTAYYSDCVTCNCYEASTPNGRDITSLAYRDCSGIVQSVAPGDSIITCINEIITYGDGNAVALGSFCKLDALCSDLTICYQMYNLFTCTVTYIDSNGVTQEASSYETICAKINSVQTVGPCFIPGNVALFSKVYDAVNNSYLPCVDCGCQPLRLGWDSIDNVPVTDPYNVADWNDFFDLPTNGTPFSAVDVIGDTVYLYGGGNMTISFGLFTGNTNLISISDGKVDREGVVLCPGIVINADENAFLGCTNLESVILPSLTTTGRTAFRACSNLYELITPSLSNVGQGCFGDCSILTEINLPSALVIQDGAFSGTSAGFLNGGYINLPTASYIGNLAFAVPATSGSFILDIPNCANLGNTVGNNNVFNGIVGCTVTLYIPGALMSCNGGQPDGDIQYLQTNNTTTIGVQIGNQIWSTRNLDVTTYRNGDVIPQVTNPIAWGALTTGAWCYYNNDPANGAVYGKLYNWYAVNDPRGLAPDGWHIPNLSEFTQLGNNLNVPPSAQGGLLKEVGTAHWASPNVGATNSSGFTALPSGIRGYSNIFTNITYISYIWLSTEFNPTNGWCMEMDNNVTDLYLGGGLFLKYNGLAVRVLKD